MQPIKLALGSAQFGSDYGVSNKTGQVCPVELRRILNSARHHSIDLIDTAINYGSAERVLGDAGVQDFNIVTKLPSPPAGVDLDSWIELTIGESLERLRAVSLHGVLIHAPSILKGPQGASVFGALMNLKRKGIAKKIGVSVYSPDEIYELFSLFDFDLVQAPFNILDRRLMQSGCLDFLSKKEVEIHGRSMFLQGLLLMSEPDQCLYFPRWKRLWREWHAWLEETGIDAVEACVNFLNAYSLIDKFLVGVERHDQLDQIVKAFDSSLSNEVPTQFSCDDLSLIDPTKWSCN